MLPPVHNPAFFTEKQKKGKEYNGNKAEVRLHKQEEKETLDCEQSLVFLCKVTARET